MLTVNLRSFMYYDLLVHIANLLKFPLYCPVELCDFFLFLKDFITKERFDCMKKIIKQTQSILKKLYLNNFVVKRMTRQFDTFVFLLPLPRSYHTEQKFLEINGLILTLYSAECKIFLPLIFSFSWT